MTKHISVFKNEVIENLKIKPDGTYVDCTFGGGGHSLEILKKLDSGKLIALDADENAISSFDQDQPNLVLVNSNFAELESVLKKQNIEFVDGIIVDLGWSTDQLDNLEGLSYQSEMDILDMRLDRNFGVTASDLLNVMNKKQLQKVFEVYGDLNYKESTGLSNQIIKSRKFNKIETVGDLNRIVKEARIDSSARNLSRIYQSLRIAVNSEYDNLNKLLESSLKLLKPNGIFVAITFHSGEHRILKEFIRENTKQERIENQINNAGDMYLQPSVQEVTENYSARSAKLWAYKKI